MSLPKVFNVVIVYARKQQQQQQQQQQVLIDAQSLSGPCLVYVPDHGYQNSKRIIFPRHSSQITCRSTRLNKQKQLLLIEKHLITDTKSRLQDFVPPKTFKIFYTGVPAKRPPKTVY